MHSNARARAAAATEPVARAHDVSQVRCSQNSSLQLAKHSVPASKFCLQQIMVQPCVPLLQRTSVCMLLSDGSSTGANQKPWQACTALTSARSRCLLVKERSWRTCVAGCAGYDALMPNLLLQPPSWWQQHVTWHHRVAASTASCKVQYWALPPAKCVCLQRRSGPHYNAADCATAQQPYLVVQAGQHVYLPTCCCRAKDSSILMAGWTSWSACPAPYSTCSRCQRLVRLCSVHCFTLLCGSSEIAAGCAGYEAAARSPAAATEPEASACEQAALHHSQDSLW